ncbi:MAG: sulfotransferase family protein [Bacteroidota bacterium]
MSLKIIGAGFPRTGTTTLKKSLEMLGFSKAYHFKDLIADPSKLKYWQALEDTSETDYERLFEGYEASVDFPGYPYYKLLMKKYPDAKVVLTIRDFDSWYDSNFNTIWQVEPTNPCLEFMRNTYLIKQFDGKFASKEVAEKVFHAHNNEVIEYVPKEQLLVYEVKDGWEPLCTFLNCDVPSEELPHLNKKENFTAMLGKMLGKS